MVLARLGATARLPRRHAGTGWDLRVTRPCPVPGTWRDGTLLPASLPTVTAFAVAPGRCFANHAENSVLCGVSVPCHVSGGTRRGGIPRPDHRVSPRLKPCSRQGIWHQGGRERAGGDTADPAERQGLGGGWDVTPAAPRPPPSHPAPRAAPAMGQRWQTLWLRSPPSAP